MTNLDELEAMIRSDDQSKIRSAAFVLLGRARKLERIRQRMREAAMMDHEMAPEPYEPNPYDGTYSEE